MNDLEKRGEERVNCYKLKETYQSNEICGPCSGADLRRQIQINILETIREVPTWVPDGYYLLGTVNFVKYKNGIVGMCLF